LHSWDRAVQIEPLLSIDEIIRLLSACALPVEDVAPSSALRFFGIREQGVLAAVVGIELHASCGLLCSLAVAPACRGRGFARGLVEFAEDFAAAQGVGTLFLLTTTAAPLFQRLGYAPRTCARSPRHSCAASSTARRMQHRPREAETQTRPARPMIN
jgi:amino-acid N-acetyltransferase